MSLTKAQALSLKPGSDLHAGNCKRVVGPRGGVKEYTQIWRVNGKVQTKKKDPLFFRVPLKFGLYAYDEVTNRTSDFFHLPGDCPLRVSETNESNGAVTYD